MSDLSKETECASFIASWREHYKDRPDLFRERMTRVAEEQRRNMESGRDVGRNVDEYERSVRLLEQAGRGDAQEPTRTQQLREAVARLDTDCEYSISEFADDVAEALDSGPFIQSPYSVGLAVDAYRKAVRDCADTAGRLPTDDAEVALQGAVEAWLRAHDPEWNGAVMAPSDDRPNLVMGPQ